MSDASRLDRALQVAGIPIIGVSVGNPADRATWTIQYAPSATAQQRADGETMRRAFDPTTQINVDAEIADMALGEAGTKDRLADFALLASVTDPGWTAATLAQKVAKVKALASTWQALRSFSEKSL